MKVLVDGLNFELPHGTGIKTYTRSVLSSLAQLGCEIDLLSQRDVPSVRHVEPEAAYLTTIMNAKRRMSPGERLYAILESLGRRIRPDPPLSAARVLESGSHLRLCPEWKHLGKVFTLPSLFDRSFAKASVGMGLTSIRNFAGADVLFLTSPVPIRLPGRLNILTVHDIIPLSHPWLIDRWVAVGKAFGESMRSLIQSADRILCVSDTTRQQLISRFHVDERKLRTVYQPCRFALDSASADTEDDATVLSRLGLSTKGYLLFVGAIEPKKNLTNLLLAMQEGKVRLPLVVVGPYGWSCASERTMLEKMKQTVFHVGYIRDSELSVLQRHAAAFVFPSLVEGFGLPPLEAFWHGVPCVLSDIPIFRELFLDYPTYVDPLSSASIASGIERAVSSSSRREEAKVYVRSQFSLARFVEVLHRAIED